MATVRDGEKAALVVVDLQVGVVEACWQVERVIGNASQVVDKARAAGLPIIWVQHADNELPSGSSGWQWVPALAPGAREPVVGKAHNSAFEQSTFKSELDALGIAHIYLLGAASNWCVRSTAFAALERGYDLTLVGDAHTTQSMTLEDGSRLEAADLVKDLNIAMTWLSYPGRTNRVRNTHELAFGKEPTGS